jgi:pimeloyl-ACP methyl ester carboxylesterase
MQMFIFRILLLALAGVGVLGLIAVVSVANPVVRLPELAAISDGVKVADRSEMPALRQFQARDGSFLAFRQYPAAGAAKEAVVLIHGSSGSSIAVHPLARVLAARGIEVFAPDIRGHGASGTRGDIAYLGQLDDDLADLVGQMRSAGVATPISLVGHSSGGGFALRIAGSKIQDLFALFARAMAWRESALKPKQCEWLGKSESATHHRPQCFAEFRHHLLRSITGHRLRRPQGFRALSDGRIFDAAADQFRCCAGLSNGF